MRTVGETRRRLAEMLTDELGFRVKPEDLRPVEGQWKKRDVYRWEALLRHGDALVSLGSTYAMKDCVRHGITLETDSSGTIEVWAKEPDVQTKQKSPKPPKKINPRTFWRPRLKLAPAQCPSCPFRSGNDKEFKEVVKRLREQLGLRGNVTSELVTKARQKIRMECTFQGEFACHLTAYDPATMKERAPSEHRQCPGAADFYRAIGERL